MVTLVRPKAENTVNTVEAFPQPSAPSAVETVALASLKPSDESSEQPGSLTEKNVSPNTIEGHKPLFIVTVPLETPAAGTSAIMPVFGQIEGVGENEADRKTQSSMGAMPATAAAASVAVPVAGTSVLAPMHAASKTDVIIQNLCHHLEEKMSDALKVIQNPQYSNYIRQSVEFVRKAATEFSHPVSHQINYEHLVIYVGGTLGFKSVIYNELVESLRVIDHSLPTKMFVPPEKALDLYRSKYFNYLYTFMAMNLNIRNSSSLDDYRDFLNFLTNSCEEWYKEWGKGTIVLVETIKKHFSSKYGTGIIQKELENALAFAATMQNFETQIPLVLPSPFEKEDYRDKAYTMFSEYLITAGYEFEYQRLAFFYQAASTTLRLNPNNREFSPENTFAQNSNPTNYPGGYKTFGGYRDYTFVYEWAVHNAKKEFVKKGTIIVEADKPCCTIL